MEREISKRKGSWETGTAGTHTKRWQKGVSKGNLIVSARSREYTAVVAMYSTMNFSGLGLVCLKLSRDFPDAAGRLAPLHCAMTCLTDSIHDRDDAVILSFLSPALHLISVLSDSLARTDCAAFRKYDCHGVAVEASSSTLVLSLQALLPRVYFR